MKCILPKLVDGKVPRGIKIRDPPSVVEAQQKKHNKFISNLQFRYVFLIFFFSGIIIPAVQSRNSPVSKCFSGVEAERQKTDQINRNDNL